MLHKGPDSSSHILKWGFTKDAHKGRPIDYMGVVVHICNVSTWETGEQVDSDF